MWSPWRVAVAACASLLAAGQATAAEGPAGLLLAAGTPILLVVDDPLSSKTSKEGDRFRLHLAESILVDGQVIVPEGATGEGEVIHVRRTSIGGKAGELIIAARYIDAAGTRVPIGHLRWGRGGADKTDMAIAVAIAAGVFGLFVTGGNVGVTPGTLANAKTTAAVSLPTPSAVSTLQGLQP